MSRTALTAAALLLTASAAFAQTPPGANPTTPMAPMSPAPAVPMSTAPGTMAPSPPSVAPLSIVQPTTPIVAPTIATSESKDLPPPVDKGVIFAIVPTNGDMSSKVIGLDIYNNAKQNIGTIKDISFNSSGVNAYIVGVGGFLGMGEHYVAIRPSAISVTYDAAAKKWRATMDTDAAQLKAAPEYKYASAS